MSVKVNRIELDKTRGLTIQVLDGANTQTIVLDGEKITITASGPGGASTIEQTPTTVTVTADEFIVNAKTIRETGDLKATMQSGASSVALTPATTEILSPALSLTGEATIDAQAPTLELTGAGLLTVVSAGELEINGANVSLTGEAAIELMAPELLLDGIPFPPI